MCKQALHFIDLSHSCLSAVAEMPESLCLDTGFCLHQAVLQRQRLAGLFNAICFHRKIKYTRETQGGPTLTCAQDAALACASQADERTSRALREFLPEKLLEGFQQFLCSLSHIFLPFSFLPQLEAFEIIS